MILTVTLTQMIPILIGVFDLIFMLREILLTRILIFVLMYNYTVDEYSYNKNYCVIDFVANDFDDQLVMGVT